MDESKMLLKAQYSSTAGSKAHGRSILSLCKFWYNDDIHKQLIVAFASIVACDKTLLKVKRKEQVNAIKSIIALSNGKKQKKLIDDLIKNIEKVITGAKLLIESKQFHSFDPFPSNNLLREALANVIENTAFFSEIVLRFPSFIGKRFSSDSNWNAIVNWAYNFSMGTNLYDDSGSKLLNLAAQQLNIIPREENFYNPYDKRNIKEEMEFEAVRRMNEAKERKLQEKKLERKRKKKNVPSLTKSEL
ncbi:unnamed protein product [Dracunculus medinensis]|uniref:Coiled-coil domain-containing protein 134 n=1 Tax=Dracunculus medinensis TaxID=318479 RepID=A0A0N4U1K0_DRAME|nr:unnamed protein product [Dracunculus medinensis]